MGNGASLPFKAEGSLTDALRLQAQSNWSNIQHGVSTAEGGEEVTVWTADKSKLSANRAACALKDAANLKMWKHPNVLKFIEMQDGDTGVVLVTERATPLGEWLAEYHKDPDRKDSGILWGLYSLFQGISFLHSRGMVHGALTVDSVMVTPGGDWKLAGLHACQKKDTASSGRSWSELHGQSMSGAFRCPFLAAAVASDLSVQAVDVWSLCVIAAAAFSPGSVDSIVSAGASAMAKVPLTSLPAPLRGLVSEVLGAGRRVPGVVVSHLASSPVFKNAVVGALLFLENLALKEPAAKQKFFKALPKVLPQMPSGMREHKVLPALMLALEFGAAGGGGTVVLAPILSIGKEIGEAKHASLIVPCVVRLFASPDRATRMQLLHYMDQYVGAMPKSVLNGDVFKHAMTGFADAQPLLREATIKAAATMAPHVEERNLSALVGHLARCMGDKVPSNRVNTVVAVCAMAPHLPAASRASTLCKFYGKALTDSVPAARRTALVGMQHSMNKKHVTAAVVAAQFLPAAAKQCIGGSGEVRQAALVTVRCATAVLEAHVAAHKQVEPAKDPPAGTTQPVRTTAPQPSPSPPKLPQPPAAVTEGWGDEGDDSFWAGMDSAAPRTSTPGNTQPAISASVKSTTPSYVAAAAPVAASGSGVVAGSDGWDDDDEWANFAAAPVPAPAPMAPATRVPPVSRPPPAAAPAPSPAPAPTAAPPAGSQGTHSLQGKAKRITLQADDGWDDW